MKFIYFLFILVLLLSCGSHENPESFNKKKSDSLNLKAYYFLNVNNFDSAKYFIDQALLLDSTNFGAYNNRAVVNFRVNGESKKIIEDFETALKIKPGYEIALFSLANYYDEIRDYKKALEASNRYEFQANTIDTGHIRIINNIRLRAQKYEKLVGHISTSQAILFYDSIQSITEETVPTQQRFVNQIAEIQKKIAFQKMNSSDFTYLSNLYDSAIIFNKIELTKIKSLNDIDSSTHYKEALENHIVTFQNALKDKFNRYIFCLKTQDIGLIRNCLASFNATLNQITFTKIEMLKAEKYFKSKYGFETVDK